MSRKAKSGTKYSVSKKKFQRKRYNTSMLFLTRGISERRDSLLVVSGCSELFLKQVDIMADLTLYLMNANDEEIKIKGL